MSLYVPDSGAISFLAARFNNTWPSSKDLLLKLFCNDKTIADDDTSAGYTEVTGGGYSAKTLTCGNWTVSIVGNVAQAAYLQQIFTFNGPLTNNPSIFGYYVVDGNNVLQWAEKFAVPVTPVSDGNHCDVTPIFQASKGTPA